MSTNRTASLGGSSLAKTPQHGYKRSIIHGPEEEGDEKFRERLSRGKKYEYRGEADG